MDILELVDTVEDMQNGKRSFDEKTLVEVVESMWDEGIFNSDELDAMERMIAAEDKEFFTFFWNVYNQYADML